MAGSVYSPSTEVARASVTLARTSEPPCFSVMPIPAQHAGLGRRHAQTGVEVVEARSGVHLGERLVDPERGTAAYVIETGHRAPAPCATTP